MIDAHCHLDENQTLIDLLKEHHISATINCQSIEEWQRNKLLTQNSPFLTLSAGIHPWDSDKVLFMDFLPILKETQIIGEIGMDRTWTNVPLDIQQDVFTRQLELASSLKKPVILHTKGQEEKIAKIIKDYPNTYLVHWYSCDSFFKDYLKLDCYFTIGPSLKYDTISQKIAKEIPLNRILFESDGLEALAWAHNLPCETIDYLKLQEDSLRYLSDLKSISYDNLLNLLQNNYDNWLR